MCERDALKLDNAAHVRVRSGVTSPPTIHHALKPRVLHTACPTLLSQNPNIASCDAVCLCVFYAFFVCWEWVMWLWASCWICHAICLYLFAGPSVVSSAAASSTRVRLLSDKCVVSESVCTCHLSVSFVRIRYLMENLRLAHTHTHTHNPYCIKTHTYTLPHRTSSPIS